MFEGLPACVRFENTLRTGFVTVTIPVIGKFCNLRRGKAMCESAQDEVADWLTAKEARMQFREPVSQQRLSNWIHRGLLNRRTQQRFFLPCKWFGGQIRITREAIVQFQEALDRQP